jgi:signal peptidase II
MNIIARVAAYRLFYVLAVIILVADQATKLWIQNTPVLPLESYWPSGGVEIIPGFFYLAHIANPGAAWGILPGFKAGFIVLAVIALVAIYYYRHALALKSMPMQFAFGLLCGGIIGNLIDRIRLHYVIDFLDFHLPGYRWPAFNVADSGISVGVTVYILATLFETRSSGEKENEELLS